MTRYHWWVLSIAILAWMFDCMAQRLFVLSRAPAVKELLNWDAYEDRILASIESSSAAEVDARIAAGAMQLEVRDAMIATRVQGALAAAFERRAAQFGDYLTALMIVGWLSIHVPCR